MEDEVSRVELRQQNRVEAERPNAVVRFFEADVVMRERVGDIEQFGADAKRAHMVIFLTRKCAGYSRGSNPAGKGCGDGWWRDAGVAPSKGVRGRSPLCSQRNA